MGVESWQCPVDGAGPDHAQLCSSQGCSGQQGCFPHMAGVFQGFLENLLASQGRKALPTSEDPTPQASFGMEAVGVSSAGKATLPSASLDAL